MKEVRVGVIGIGNMGWAHVTHLLDRSVEGMTLTAVCDIDEKKRQTAAQKAPNIAIYENSHDLITSGECDAVIVATPHYFHPEICMDALRNGLHVLSEKPIGVYTKQVEELYEVARKSDKVFAVMYNQRTNAIFEKAWEIVQSGRLGELKRVVWIITNWYRNQAYYDSGSWRATWKGEGGGVMLNQCVHNIDLWQWIAGMPVELQAFVNYGQFHNIEVDDNVTIQAKYANGAMGTFITSTGEFPGTNRLEISGDRAKMVVEEGKLKLWEFAPSEREYCFNSDTNTPKPAITYSEPACAPWERAHQGQHTGICQNFANAILYGEKLISPGLEGINALQIINGAYLSSWTGQPVKLPVDGELYKKLLDERVATSSLRDVQDHLPSSTAKTLDNRWSVQW